MQTQRVLQSDMYNNYVATYIKMSFYIHIGLYELSAENIIIKLSAYSIRDYNRKIPIDCGKCHVEHDVTVLLT